MDKRIELEENVMKHTKKPTLWYNPVFKDTRRFPMGNDLLDLTADQEGRALLESYCRMYHEKL